MLWGAWRSFAVSCFWVVIKITAKKFYFKNGITQITFKLINFLKRNHSQEIPSMILLTIIIENIE